MISNITLIKLFEEMMVSEKISSANTRRAYVSDIKTFIGFLKSENEMSVLSIEKKHLTAWLSKLNDDNISRNTFLRKISISCTSVFRIKPTTTSFLIIIIFFWIK